MKKIVLWRAASDDYIPDAASFSRHRSDAEEYLTNRGFGGDKLWRTLVSVKESSVLDLFEESDAVELLARRFGLHHPGALGVEEWIPRTPDVQAGLHSAGYDWVIVRDSFPEGAETWLWIGEFDVEPELREVTRSRRDLVKKKKG